MPAKSPKTPSKSNTSGSAMKTAPASKAAKPADLDHVLVDHTVTLRDNKTNKEIELKVLKGTDGPDSIDIRPLLPQFGMLTYDPGFGSTANCRSGITFIDGDEGILRHRGYDIADLAEKGDFMEVCHLLLHGELPTAPEKKEFEEVVRYHTMLHEQIYHMLEGYRRDAHPMAVMVGIVGGLSAFYHDSLDIADPAQRMLASHRLIAKMPTIAAMAYKYSIGQPYAYPQNSLKYAENFLHMTFSVPAEPYVVNPVLARALDRIMILHADHEQNASTSTVRLAGSSGANTYACIAAGIATLWGPLHGGANEAVLKMLAEIGDKKNIPNVIKRAKDKNDDYRLMGFGHRVYKNYDPRAQVMKKTCEEVLKELGVNDPMLEVAMELERIALSDEYFISKKLYPNVDFYSGIILRAMGFPTKMFTMLFAVARTAGWIAQWKEMIEDSEQRIGRPRQIYVGETLRKYVPLSQRGGSKILRAM